MEVEVRYTYIMYSGLRKIEAQERYITVLWPQEMDA
jgi:hypothetical protein